MLPADLSPPGVAAVHDVVCHQEEGLQELHCPAQDVGQPVQWRLQRLGLFISRIIYWEKERGSREYTPVVVPNESKPLLNV